MKCSQQQHAWTKIVVEAMVASEEVIADTVDVFMVEEKNSKEEVVEDTILLKDEETIINQDLSLAIHEIEVLGNLALARIKMTSGAILSSLKRIESEIYAMLHKLITLIVQLIKLDSLMI